jgi:predicted nucleotidyltransferase
MAVKPSQHRDTKEISYTKERWEKLRLLRKKAIEITAALEKFHLPATAHGSIARGDIKLNSDVDIFIAEVQNSFQVETALEKAKIPISTRFIVQATPNYAMKAHIEIDDNATVTFPLMEMRKVEREFYHFGGEVDFDQLKANIRVAGVDKRLMLIKPTPTGHIESSIIKKEESVAKLLGISSETVLDRVHALVRRDTVGRTGVFVKREIATDETFELALKKLADANPWVRKRIKK